MNLKNILWVRNTGDIVPKAPIGDNLFGLKLSGGGSGVITTATGNPISIITNKAQNAISTILSYSPRQSGSGDPSPENIRPIEGWTEANLTGAGKNLLDLSTLATTGITYENGVLTGTASAFNTAYSSGIPFDFSFLKNARVSIACEAKVQTASGTSNGLRMRITYTDGTYSDFSWKNNDDSYVRKYFASAEGKSVSGISITYNNTGSNVWFIRDFQIEVGTVPTDYTPFITPTETAISLGGTYYGFSIDVERGKLVAAQKLIDFSAFDGQINRAGTSADHYYFQCNWTDDDLGTGIPVCDILPYESITSANTMRGVRVATSSTFGKRVINIRPVDNCNMSVSEFRAWLAEQSTFHICVTLENPIEIDITPQTVALLAGSNTIWTDGDEVSVTYKAKRG